MEFDSCLNSIVCGDNREVTKDWPNDCVDAIVTDPPYGLEFMGKEWDKLNNAGRNREKAITKSSFGKIMDSDYETPRIVRSHRRKCAICGGYSGGPFQLCNCNSPQWIPSPYPAAMQQWHYVWAKEALRIAKPGAMMLVFGGTRTVHRLTCAIEDAGWQIRDKICWLFGSGFPKSLNISKAIDKRGGCPALARKIGIAIKRAREKRGFSVIHCDKLFCGGTTNWSWFEGRPAGQRPPTPETFAKICKEWPEVKPLAKMVAEAQREIVGKHKTDMGGLGGQRLGEKGGNVTVPATDLAKLWDGYGTGLKPAYEDIVVCMKPLDGTFAANAEKWKVAGLNIDGSRILSNNNLTGQRPCGKLQKKERSLQWDAEASRSNLLVDNAAKNAKPTVQAKKESIAQKNAVPTLSEKARKHQGDISTKTAAGFSSGQSRGVQNTALNESTNLNTAESGNNTMGQSQKDMSSTILTETNSITESKTCNLLHGGGTPSSTTKKETFPKAGRWPSNVILGCNCEGEHGPDCPCYMLDKQSGELKSGKLQTHHKRKGGGLQGTQTFAIRDRTGEPCDFGGDSGGASRFFYCAKASRAERNAGLEGMEEKDASQTQSMPTNQYCDKCLGWKTTANKDKRCKCENPQYTNVPAKNHHPTVKPLKLMEYLCTLLKPPTENPILLDCFAGSGTTLIAALNTGWDFIGIEKEADYVEITKRRIEHWRKQKQDALPLFGTES